MRLPSDRLTHTPRRPAAREGRRYPMTTANATILDLGAQRAGDHGLLVERRPNGRWAFARQQARGGIGRGYVEQGSEATSAAETFPAAVAEACPADWRNAALAAFGEEQQLAADAALSAGRRQALADRLFSRLLPASRPDPADRRLAALAPDLSEALDLALVRDGR